MPETPQNWEIDVDKAAEILGVSTRTVRRYAKDGKIDYRRVQGKFGEELRFSEKELRQLANDRSNGTDKSSQATEDKSGNGVNSGSALNAQALWRAYQELQAEYRNAAAQIGFLRNQAEEVPKLTERAESLQKQKEEAQQAKVNAEQKKAELEATLAEERRERDRLHRQMLWNTVAYVILSLAIAAVLILLSPNYSEIISRLLNP